ncbi:hypothetical protein, partial [Mycobacterium avium]|uniref:hypothetical protein n=1 Tax=Mycobacterium avium TaxID=1764 RepID=UPI001F390BA1
MPTVARGALVATRRVAVRLLEQAAARGVTRGGSCVPQVLIADGGPGADPLVDVGLPGALVACAGRTGGGCRHRLLVHPHAGLLE